MSDNFPQFIGSAKPFSSKAKEYQQRGWAGVMPLPAKEKFPPPGGFTGRSGTFATSNEVDDWINDRTFDADGKKIITSKGNIGIHLGNVVNVADKEYEVIGLDVDHHPDEEKFGYDQLQTLQSKYGVLPDTFTSSSRNDGLSGIRFYLVPKGYAFRGNCGEHGSHIDVIQRVHRYAVVYPSYHPKGGQYLWYKPGVATKGYVEQDIPWTSELPELPEKWVEFLTRGNLKDSDGYGIDLDISSADVVTWAEAKFPVDLDKAPGGMCPAMRKKVSFWRDKIDGSSDSHYQIVSAHWNSLLWAAEGHHGWKAAIRLIEKHYVADTLNRGKRELTEVKKEVFRSRINALRKIKAKCDSYAEKGLSYFGRCTCTLGKESFSKVAFTTVSVGSKAPDGGNVAENGSQGDEISAWLGSVEVLDVPLNKKYERNDDGNAECMYDMFNGNIHWLTNWGKWLIYDGSSWVIDDKGLAKALFREKVVKEFFGNKVKYMIQKMQEYLAQAGNSANDKKYEQMEKDLVSFRKWTEQCGNMSRSENALAALKSFPKVSKKYEELNADPYLLQTTGGKVVRLTRRSNSSDDAGSKKVRGFVIERAAKEHYITFSTAASYRKFNDQDQGAIKLWNNYLNTFIPDSDYRRFVRKAFGHAIIGGNPERLAIFLQGGTSTGKSTILNAVQAAMGTYAGPFNPNNVFMEKQSGLNPELGNHLQRRIICASEAGSQNIHANVFKRITGRDKITVERKGVNDIIEAVPAFVPIVATNAAPNIKGEDEALRKRIMVLPFDIRIADNADNKQADSLIAEKCKDIVLFWLMHGYADYVNEGLDWDSWHPMVKERTVEFNSSMSTLGEFLSEECLVIDREQKERLSTAMGIMWPDEWQEVTVGKLFARYSMWCEKYNMRQVSQRTFSGQIANLGYQRHKRKIDNKSETVWRGIKLQSQKILT